MQRRRTKHFHHPRNDDYRIIVTGAPRPDINVDALAKVIVRLAQKLAAGKTEPTEPSKQTKPKQH